MGLQVGERARRVCAGLCVVLGLACDDAAGSTGSTLPEYRGDEQVTAMVDKAGASLVLGDDVAVRVPAGALAQAEELKVTRVAARDLKAGEPGGRELSDLVRFEPHGLKFDRPVEIELRLKDDGTPDARIGVLRLDDEEDASWERVGDTRVLEARDTEGLGDGERMRVGSRRVQARTRTFSIYAAVELPGQDAGADGGRGGDGATRSDASASSDSGISWDGNVSTDATAGDGGVAFDPEDPIDPGPPAKLPAVDGALCVTASAANYTAYEQADCVTYADSCGSCWSQSPAGTAGQCAGEYCNWTHDAFRCQIERPAGACHTEADLVLSCEASIERAVTRHMRNAQGMVISSNGNFTQEDARAYVEASTREELLQQHPDPISPACLDCYVIASECERDQCLGECLAGDSLACDQCQEAAGCTPALFACTGLPDPHLVDPDGSSRLAAD